MQCAQNVQLLSVELDGAARNQYAVLVWTKTESRNSPARN